MKRWFVLYDEAAQKYAEACNEPIRSIKRYNMRHWKKMMMWLDSELTKAGEIYLEKTEEA